MVNVYSLAFVLCPNKLFNIASETKGIGCSLVSTFKIFTGGAYFLTINYMCNLPRRFLLRCML